MSVARFGHNGGHFYSNIVQPVYVNCNFTVDSANGNGLGIRSLKSNGWINNVFMYTSASAGTNNGVTNPMAHTASEGYALIQFKQNFNYYLGGFNGFVSQLSGSNVAINGSALTVGSPYVITNVGAVPGPSFTIAYVADSSGSLASKYFTLADQAGNNYVLWYQVSGVGSAPALVGPLNGYQAVPVSISTNAANTAVASATDTVIAALNGSASFTTSLSGHTATVTGANANTNLNFTNLPQAQNSGFTMSAITFTSLQADWNIVGLPKGFTPSVGAAFIATATGDGGLNSTAHVQIPVATGSKIQVVDVIGNSNALIQNQSIAANAGAWVMVRFLAATDADTTTLVATAPLDNSTVGLSFMFDQSSVTIDGL